jgi:hypothetical protein
VTIKATTRCLFPDSIGHLDFFQPLWPHPPLFNGNVLLEFPPSHVSTSTSENNMDSMAWSCTITSNIHNTQGLTFRKSSCVGQLVCNNQKCDFFSELSKKNETKGSGQTNILFNLGHSSLPDSILLCKVFKVPPTCINFCNAHIYYVLSKSAMTRACIHLGMHNHPISYGICQETLDIIYDLIIQKVS